MELSEESVGHVRAPSSLRDPALQTPHPLAAEAPGLEPGRLLALRLGDSRPRSSGSVPGRPGPRGALTGPSGTGAPEKSMLKHAIHPQKLSVSLREYGFAHCDAAAAQPSLALRRAGVGSGPPAGGGRRGGSVPAGTRPACPWGVGRKRLPSGSRLRPEGGEVGSCVARVGRRGTGAAAVGGGDLRGRRAPACWRRAGRGPSCPRTKSRAVPVEPQPWGGRGRKRSPGGRGRRKPLLFVPGEGAWGGGSCGPAGCCGPRLCRWALGGGGGDGGGDGTGRRRGRDWTAEGTGLDGTAASGSGPAGGTFVLTCFSFLPSPPLPTPSINIILLKILRCQAAKVESAIAEGGASRFSASSDGGGSRGGPQHYPKTAGNSEFLGKTPGQNAQKWIPARSTRRDDNSAANNSANEKERHDAIFRKVRGILNKLTPEKFDKLCLELLNVGVESKLILKGVILLIVDKALEEPKYSSLYAQLCLRLAEDAPNFDGPAAEGQPGQKQSTTFRRLLISKLQDEFENRTRNVDVYDKRENPLLPEEEEQRAIAKIKMLGNIKFIGELGKLDLIHESILHKCIKTLLEKKKRVQLKDMGEDLECLCQIMRTVGPRLDHERAKSLMDQYFARMCSLMLSKELPARIRFLLQDTVELREHHWVPRKAFLDNGPKTINQIRQDAVKDLGVFIPAPMAQGMRSDFFLEGPFMPPRMKMDRDPLGGLADMFGQMPGSGIGTGPGVIQDRFSPTMGRHRSSQLFNGHGGHIMPPSQSQFGEMGGKFMKSQGLSQLYHNQSQGLLSQLQGQSKDMPPRFSKKGQLNADEISLRPAQSFLMNKNQVPKLQPQITMIPPSAQPPRTQTPPLGQTPQLGLKTNPPLIQEKPAKTSKKPPPSKEELLKLTETVVTEYLNSGNANEAVNGVREMRAPKHFLPEMLSKVILLSLDRSDEDKEKASSLISLLKQEGIATSDNFMQAFLNVLDQCPKLEVDIPLVKSYLAQFAARAIISELVSISELAQPLESGTHFPLFLLCLQQLAKLQDREWLTELFQQSKVNMQKMLPEIDQNKDRMLEILEGKGLSFLFPLLKLEKELLKQIKLDPSPQTIYKWIKDNISPKLHVDKGFVNILMTSFLQYISSEVNPPSDETDSSSTASKEQVEQEKQLLLSFKPVMQKFLHDHVDLQVSALYALQVHCFNSNFPKGMLLRFFVYFYDMEIIEEEAFLAWKEDITQEFPGKGKALFQVNQWLTWLETAEEEESEEEAD
ncbi:PREDICTED: eukaryotic translation initiation factor 4 gamma 2 [Elephantulus edwardii]|uniref:eukaryotic translation initiation factor 4 gamma 2 n=1 Tax=Elephantulus edwardii TaxID=28737 RepID=UPI0003F0C214|nr:PREDICTED: eukaryotic translation initiation factor 4 gamma 2 [Elephantulus edwardii]